MPGGGTSGATNSPMLMKWLKTKVGGVNHVMSVCTGAMILGEAGLLDSLEATVTYGMEEPLAKTGTNIKVRSPRRFVDAGKFITTAGLTSGIDGALHLISKMVSLCAAQQTALSMEYRWSPDSNYSRAALADRFMPDGLKYGGVRIKGIEASMVSTEGDTDHWEAKLLVSDPKSEREILDALGNRIKSGTSHIRGAVQFSEATSKAPARLSQLKWKFTDDQGDGWTGSAVTASSTTESGKFGLTLKVARSR